MATINALCNTDANGFTVSSGNLVVTTGNISTSTGSISAYTTVTAATGVTATTGNITATAGDVVVTAGSLKLPTSTASVGMIEINSVPVFSTYGTNNTFVGTNSGGSFGFNTTYNTDNVGLGYQSLYSLAGTAGIEGCYNTCLGAFSGNAISSGSNNTLVGWQSGYVLSSGTDNTSCGQTSMNALVTGSYNTCLGTSSGNALTTSDSSNICIGALTIGTAGDNNKLTIGVATGTGNGEISSTVICGITGKTSTSGVAVYVNSSNVLGTSTSNRDSKQDITDMGEDSAIIYNLRPRTFKFKADTDPKPKQYGMIAEEVESIFPEMVAYNKDGKPTNLFYQFLAPMLVNELQKLEKRVSLLEQLLKEK
jgi:hypothetical protein